MASASAEIDGLAFAQIGRHLGQSELTEGEVEGAVIGAVEGAVIGAVEGAAVANGRWCSCQGKNCSQRR